MKKLLLTSMAAMSLFCAPLNASLTENIENGGKTVVKKAVFWAIKHYIKTHKTKLLLGTVLLLGAPAYLYYKNHKNQ